MSFIQKVKSKNTDVLVGVLIRNGKTCKSAFSKEKIVYILLELLLRRKTIFEKTSGKKTFIHKHYYKTVYIKEFKSDNVTFYFKQDLHQIVVQDNLGGITYLINMEKCMHELLVYKLSCI